MVEMVRIKRMEVRYADLGENIGHLQGGIRPVVIIQNDEGNKHCGTIQIIPLTTNISKSKYPVRVLLDKRRCRLKKTSVAMCEQLQAINKEDVKDFVCKLPEFYMKEIEKAIKLNLNIC